MLQDAKNQVYAFDTLILDNQGYFLPTNYDIAYRGPIFQIGKGGGRGVLGFKHFKAESV